ncbi:c-type cytochrome [Loktanella sp. IMCC34160]|uniref:cytochrome c n=1 Tax=Loktanella sp. IMCC34160 TaxID=2510646 RepID=UPI00101D6107|nr:cytochrome c [Loktanella sp. IMCC34160]RYG92098.1 c-type cytochrome [Loktanella sp. IMCC34160]
MRFRKTVAYLAGAAVVVAAVGLYLTRPRHVDPAEFDRLTGDVERGALVFAATGCASCHAAPEAEGEARRVLSGGRGFASPFGTFYAPNISPGPVGTGDWTVLNLADALRHGTSPDNRHYFPAFPYGSYSRMQAQDIADLHAYLMTLPASDAENRPHDVGFPFNIRAALGGWKMLFASDDWVLDGDLTETQQRGRYLVEAMGHCAECHTPRNALGGLQTDRWLAGAPIPGKDGRVPNITPAALSWSEAEIVEYLTSGFTPDFDSAGGEMFEVVQNTAQLPRSDREAIAAYLKIVPPIGN